MFLSRADTHAIDARIAAVEAATGVEVVTAVIGKADAYPELPWKAFALGTAFAALATVAADALAPAWNTGHAALAHAVAILGAGGACALAAVFAPAFARLFLRAARSHTEVAHYARALFAEREIFRTRERTGVLILVALFERRVEIVPDTGLRDRLAAADWHEVVRAMTSQLTERRPAEALLAGLDALAALLARRGYRAGAPHANELPDKPIEARGE